MRIYVAGPYSRGDVLANVNAAIDAATALLGRGHQPFVPHLHHWWNARTPHAERAWLDLDLAWLEVSDAVLRLPGSSAGAKRECERAKQIGIPVFFSLDEVPRP